MLSSTSKENPEHDMPRSENTEPNQDISLSNTKLSRCKGSSTDKPKPEHAELCNSRGGPSVKCSNASATEPKSITPRMKRGDSEQVWLRNDGMNSNLRWSRTNGNESRHEEERSGNDNPKVTLSGAGSVEPGFTFPKTDHANSSWAKFRSSEAEPSCKGSMASIKKSRQTKDRTKSNEPSVVSVMTGRTKTLPEHVKPEAGGVGPICTMSLEENEESHLQKSEIDTTRPARAGL